MDLPNSAIRLLVLYASSNTELACISNVCRRWREITTQTVLDTARESLEKAKDGDVSTLLLLPSMVRYIIGNEKDTNNDIESYCLAWFTPEGIRFRSLPANSQDSTDYEDGHAMMTSHHQEVAPSTFSPGGEQLHADETQSFRQQKIQPATPADRSIVARLRTAGSESSINCLYQWDGLRDPVDVLVPFGYADVFIKNLIDLARSAADVGSDAKKAKKASRESRKISIQSSTCAVRGATIARPEGYCLCWDVDDLASLMSRRGTEHEIPELNVRIDEADLTMTRERRLRRRKELQREVLPKVLSSAPKATRGGLQLGIQQPSIQFLNLDSSNAVRLFTPPFKPSPAPTPITVFCVGIATEDGCFMSGITQQFEVGHLYPETPRDDMIERSPICLCTDALNAPPRGPATNKREEEVDDNDASYNSDDSSYEPANDLGFKCSCSFSGLSEAYYERYDYQPVDQVCRGNLGPGAWHCYVAVFDGLESKIRIDGEPENTRCDFPRPSEAAILDGLTIGSDHTFSMSLCYGQGSDVEGQGAIAELAVFKGKLDEQDIKVMEHRLMTKYGIPPPALPESERLEENHYYRLAHAMLSHPPGHKLFVANTQRIPLRYMTKHWMVAWRQTNPVTGEPIHVPRIGSKCGESSSDW